MDSLKKFPLTTEGEEFIKSIPDSNLTDDSFAGVYELLRNAKNNEIQTVSPIVAIKIALGRSSKIVTRRDDGK